MVNKNLRVQILKEAKYKCFYCGASIRGFNATIDHKNPRSRLRINSKNVDSKENLVACCRSCNTAKGMRTVEEFDEWIRNVARQVFLREVKGYSFGKIAKIFCKGTGSVCATVNNSGRRYFPDMFKN